METIPTPVPPQPSVPVPMGFAAICSRCHQPVRPEWYYCPNCGVKITEAPLGTSVTDQLLLYGFSLVLPWIAYLAITKWQGIRYLRSPDPRARQMGVIALVLLVVSSVVAFWQAYIWIQGYVQQQTNDLNNLGL